MFKNSTLLFLLFQFFPLVIFAQEGTPSEAKQQSTIPDIEKVYLHTDRDYYVVGESLWYKAYAVYAYTNILYDNSKVLYVELIAPDKKIISRNVTRLEDGLGNGDFILSDSLGVKPGTYHLRAYTNWMRNFGEDFFFNKEIQIVSGVKDNLGTTKENALSASKNTNKTNKDATAITKALVDFFPEGGSLIENVSSYLAFKATDQNGNPLDIKGNILDSTGKIIATLQSTHDGMGKVLITPEKNQSYYAEVTTADNEQLKIAIPKAESTGYALSMNFVKGKKVITIKTNQETLNKKPDSPVTLIGSTRGITYYEDSQPLNQTKISFLLPEDDFPEGIAKITLLDDELKPQTERLLYIEKNHELNIELTTDKEQYNPKEKVNIKISAKDKLKTPLVASFSMAVTEKNEKVKETDNSNIASYFLMESDIRGKINNPSYYFNVTNPQRFANLDLLLITQGWRDFLWKKIPTLKDTPSFKLEKGIKISGKVENLLSSAAKANSQVRMVLLKNQQSILLNTITDANGRFEFNDNVFTGDVTLMLNTQNESGKNRGKFLLDSIYKPASLVTYKETELIAAEKTNLNKFQENVEQKNLFFNIPQENMLNDVTVKGKKKKDEMSKFGFADHTFIAKENQPNFSTIYLYIQFSVPGVTASKNSVRFNSSNGPALILIDGVPSEVGDLEFIMPDDVAKIESFKTANAAVFGSQGANGALLIYTKEGSTGSKSKKVFHSISKEILGYQEARIFFSPDYSNANSTENDKADIRNTIYWNPYIHPDANGNAEASFYNSEVSTPVKVSLEGITKDGIPVVVEKTYTVKK